MRSTENKNWNPLLGGKGAFCQKIFKTKRHFFSCLEYIWKVSSKSAMVSFLGPHFGGEGGICQKIFRNKGHDSIKLSTRWHWNEVSPTICSYRYAANKLFWKKKNWNPILGAFVKKFSRTKGTTPVKYLQDDTKMKSLRQFVDIDMPRTKQITDRRMDGLTKNAKVKPGFGLRGIP